MADMSLGGEPINLEFDEWWDGTDFDALRADLQRAFEAGAASVKVPDIGQPDTIGHFLHVFAWRLKADLAGSKLAHWTVRNRRNGGFVLTVDRG